MFFKKKIYQPKIENLQIAMPEHFKEATEEAKENLPHLHDFLESNKAGDLGMALALIVVEGEWVWMANVRKKGDGFWGQFATPTTLNGDSREFPESAIVDWGIVTKDRPIGFAVIGLEMNLKGQKKPIEDFLNKMVGAYADFLKKHNLRTVSNSDEGFAQALRRAKETLPEFLKFLHEKPELYQATVKARFISPEGKGEHLWIENALLLEGGKVQGNVANDPANIPSLKLNDVVSVPIEDISDWKLYDSNKKLIYGAYTMKIMIESMEPAQQQRFYQQIGTFIEGMPTE